MASSDDEVDCSESVSNYYFVNDDEEPVSLSILPISWNTNEIIQDTTKQIYVRGNADGGLHIIYKPVRAWKFDISGVKPDISVFSRDNNWIKLQKPRKSFEEYVRTVLITVNFLHLVKRNPELHGKVLWEKLSRIFSSHEERPSPNDLVDHKALIEQAVKQDESLTKSKYLMSFLERNPLKKYRADEDVLDKGKSDFIVDDDDCAIDFEEDGSGDEKRGSAGEEDGSADEEDGEEEPFDSVCSICDEGGTLLCCEGSCLRSFHATPRAAEKAKSGCVSLGFTEKQVQAMPFFKCENCLRKLHQCFLCGRLGSSNKQSGAEVFQCVNATCGYFYHPRCVAKRLCWDSEDACKELEEKIRAGESFTCPLHMCFVCKQPEDRLDPELQMAVCRRCPKAYHRKCLPRKIFFEADEDKGIAQRAWEDLLVDRILIYCLKHEIIDELGTPLRDHIKFPGDGKKEKESSPIVSTKDKPKMKKLALGASQVPPTWESKKKTIGDSYPDKMNDRRVSELKGSIAPRKLSTEKKSVLTKVDGSSRAEEQKSSQQFDVAKRNKTEKLGEVESTRASNSTAEKFVLQLDSDSQRRILDLMNDVSSTITLDAIIQKHEKLNSSRAYKQKPDSCRSITLGRVEKLCEAVRDATRKLDGGCSFEDVKNVIRADNFSQMVIYKSKLRVYLAPFLYGLRYTSFGRHFTKIDKLKEIVDKIHWYVDSDDTIVDFCCGANDFSWIMKEKLESTGKKCNYKNYDLFRPKNDFCFERRDWMTVQPRELPTGSKLIMGLNPPFGVRASRANMFIDKALQFKPKLLILIVPPETERLEKKRTPYDLVWQDNAKLSGRSFYLPGSVDVNDKQMEDWNVVAPVLYLWSRPDWTPKHEAIATKHGHLHEEQRELPRDLSFKNPDPGIAVKEIVCDAPRPHQVSEGTEKAKQSGPKGHDSKDEHTNASRKNSRASVEDSRKKRHSEETRIGEAVESSREYKRKRSSPHDPYPGVARGALGLDAKIERLGGLRHSPVNTRDGRPSIEDRNLRRQGSPSKTVLRDPVHSHFEPTSYGDGRHSSEGRPFAYPGSRSPLNKETPDPGHDHFEPTSYRARRLSVEGHSFKHQGPPSNMELRDPSNDYLDPIGYGDRRITLESCSFRYQGSPSNVGIRDLGHDHFEPTSYGYGSYGSGQLGNFIPQTHVYPSVRERWSMDAGPRPESRLQNSSSWAPGSYMRSELEIHGINPLYSGTEQRYRTPTYPTESSAYNRMNSMSAMDKYNPRLDELNPHPHVTMDGGYGPPDLGRPAGSGLYDHDSRREEYPGNPMGFGPGLHNRLGHHSSAGRWIND